jgi:geranylgeranylglycerol-phosphate geranylgeranyltransferase
MKQLSMIEVPDTLGARIYAALRMTRPLNWMRMQIPATVLGILGGFYALKVTWSQLPAALLANVNQIIGSIVTVGCLSAAGYVINDYFDQDIDRVNQPNRPIPSGLVSSKMALTIAIGLFVAGLVSSFLVGMVNIVVAGLWVFFGVWYAASLKRSGYGFESLAFGIIMGLTAMFGSAAVLHSLSNLPVWLLASFMSVYITALHMNGTLKDVKGDSQNGCKTVAIIFGEATTRTLIPLVYFLSFLLLLYTAWNHLAVGPALSLFMVIFVTVIMFANIRAMQSGTHEGVVKAHGVSKTFLYAIFLLLMVHFVTGR